MQGFLEELDSQKGRIILLGREICRGRPISRSWAAPTEPKSADFCQDRPPSGAVPRLSDYVIMTSLRHFTYFSVQMLSKCVIFALFCHNGAEDRPPQGAVPRPGKSKKAVWGSSEGRAPSGDAVRQRHIGRPSTSS